MKSMKAPAIKAPAIKAPAIRARAIKVLAIAAAFVAGAGIPAAGAIAGSERVLYAFQGNSDGASPLAGVVEFNGALYGTTIAGGTDNAGTLFALTPRAGQWHEAHYFLGGNEGSQPVAALIAVGATLYGTASVGGRRGYGTVFSFAPATGIITPIHAFAGGPFDGATPAASLLHVGNALFGTTEQGGLGGYFGWGTVFEVNLGNNREETLYRFGAQPSDGYDAAGSLINLNGTLYSTTYGQNLLGCGTVFSLNHKQPGKERVLHTFPCSNTSDGDGPLAGLVSLGGMLYGTTMAGGAAGVGTIFVVNPLSGEEAALYSFSNSSAGSEPFDSLLNDGGILIGTTEVGGATNANCPYGCGTVFSFDPKTGVETVIYAFQGGTDGADPRANVIDVAGTLYGTTVAGGTYGLGTVFAITR